MFGTYARNVVAGQGRYVSDVDKSCKEEKKVAVRGKE